MFFVVYFPTRSWPILRTNNHTNPWYIYLGLMMLCGVVSHFTPVVLKLASHALYSPLVSLALKYCNEAVTMIVDIDGQGWPFFWPLQVIEYSIFLIVIVLIFFVIWLPWSISRTTKYTFFRCVYLGLLIIKLSSEALYFFLEHPALKYLVSIFCHNKTGTMVVKLVYIFVSLWKLVCSFAGNCTVAGNRRGTTSTLSSTQERRLRSFVEGTEVAKYLKNKVAQTDVVSDDIQQRLPDDQQNLLENAPVIDVSDNDGHARSTGTQGGKFNMHLDANRFFHLCSFAFVGAVLFSRLVHYCCANVFWILFSLHRDVPRVYRLGCHAGYCAGSIAPVQSDAPTSRARSDVHVLDNHDVLFWLVANDPFLAQCLVQSAHHLFRHVCVAAAVRPTARGCIVH